MSATVTRRADRGLDWYETPEWCVRAILPHLPSGVVFDPCCGRGAVLSAARSAWGLDCTEAFGFELDEGRAEEAKLVGIVEQRDALDDPGGDAWPVAYGTVVVMNPPFLCAETFIRRALSYARDTGGTVAALLRLGFLEGRSREAFHRAHPADVYVLPRRPSFTGKGTDATAYAWFVWGPGRGGRWSILEVSP
jgi:hypothetical protein